MRKTALGHGRKFFALVDDDIFFPSMGKLLQKLNRFNAGKEYYIGAPSERTDWVFDNNQAFTYGGGAVFLTVPLAEKPAQQPCLKQIIRDDEAGDQWDMTLFNCVEQSGEMDLQVLPKLLRPRRGLPLRRTRDHPERGVRPGSPAHHAAPFPEHAQVRCWQGTSCHRCVRRRLLLAALSLQG